MSLIGQVDDSVVKACCACGEEKPLDAFVKNKGGKFGVHSKCRLCQLEYKAARKERDNLLARERRKNNPEQHRQYGKTYYNKNPEHFVAKKLKRRALLESQTPELTAEEQQRIQDIYWLAKDLRAVTGEEYHVDHIIPLAKGGLHHPDNLQVLPADLNLKKGAKV